jgi:hypothetical protein
MHSAHRRFEGGPFSPQKVHLFPKCLQQSSLCELSLTPLALFSVLACRGSSRKRGWRPGGGGRRRRRRDCVTIRQPHVGAIRLPRPVNAWDHEGLGFCKCARRTTNEASRLILSSPVKRQQFPFASRFRNVYDHMGPFHQRLIASRRCTHVIPRVSHRMDRPAQGR